MKKILAVFGTRPDAIKMCPLVLELKRRESIEVKVCLTGQHRELLDAVTEIFGVKADYDLSVMGKDQTLEDVTTKIIDGITPILQKEKPDIVLVHGDTTTAFAAALAAFYLKIPVGHVEAGLRTYRIDSPYPEEFNRRAVSLISTFDFAPTEAAKANLIGEGKAPERVFVTGNTVIDALKYTVKEVSDASGRLILLTAHRRENIGEPMRNIFSAVKRVAEKYDDIKIVYPMHPNPAVRSIAGEILGDCDKVELTEPLDLAKFHTMLSKSYCVLTDSGGVQEEAAALGKPVLILRDTTERTESDSLMLVGTNEDDVAREFERLLEDEELYNKMKNAPNPYGDGNASARIADIIERI
ncbi:MAG: UDP-N-acetylglucosamine 2-epimerase (non-hydrolyzing) [Clostridia bacterium]|nr:UDP-N-acetylglucosamine 2-epimerase (non-hydrolyzing) [Clostridia bacterium]